MVKVCLKIHICPIIRYGGSIRKKYKYLQYKIDIFRIIIKSIFTLHISDIIEFYILPTYLVKFYLI
jgi:hypothetical protein